MARRIVAALSLRGEGHQLPHRLLHRAGGDPMGLVVSGLLVPAALGLLHGPGHGGGDGVGVQDHHAVRVPGRPADGLDQ